MVIKDFDASMKRYEVFARYHCPSVEELLAAFDGLEIVRADVVDTPVHNDCGDDDYARGPWTAALFRARLPLAG